MVLIGRYHGPNVEFAPSQEVLGSFPLGCSQHFANRRRRVFVLRGRLALLFVLWSYCRAMVFGCTDKLSCVLYAWLRVDLKRKYVVFGIERHFLEFNSTRGVKVTGFNPSDNMFGREVP